MSQHAWFVVLLLLFLLVPSSATAEPSRHVATLDGRGLSKDRLIQYWFDRYPAEYGRTLTELIEAYVVADGARAAGLDVPRATLDKAVDDEVAARRKWQRELYGDGADLAAWVRNGYGMSIDAWQRTILRPRLRARMLKQRVIRADTRRELLVYARIIIVADETRARRIAAKLRNGADFSLTALKQSEHETKKAGGTLPPIARGDMARFPVIERRLFEARPGQLIGPLRVQIDGAPQWQIYKLIRRSEPWHDTGPALRARIETDLADLPVTRGELERWQARIRRKHRIELFAPNGRPWSPPSGG